jgi:hypothetical protein
MSAFDLGCVKTQKFEKRRELFFSDHAKATYLLITATTIASSKKRSFCRCHSPLRFYTAKTQSGHERFWIAAAQNVP